MHPPADALLAWYDRHARSLPWRGSRDPYRIWVSEVMLQQTTVAAVGPRYARFIARFPDAAALARAEWAELAEEWAGLGYYARARHLHRAARAIAAGGMPRDAAGWRALPGIGPYTAAAIAAIAHDEPVVPVDGNVERVIARLFAVEAPLPGARRALAELAGGFAAQPAMRARPGDFAQALFDLGATLCTPRAPACALCPWREDCRGRAEGIAAALPRRAPKPARGVLHGVHFALADPAGRLLLERRPEGGLLGGMLGLPGTPWRAAPWEEAEALAHAPLAGVNWRPLPGAARHILTHRELSLRLYAGAAPGLPAGAEALPAQQAASVLPAAMRKLLRLLGPSAGFTGA
jgi:A/G-specific adenine glycosylase